MEIAKSFKIGNTEIKIATDYCKGKTQEEVDEILKRIAQNALSSFNAGNNQISAKVGIQNGDLQNVPVL